MNIETSLTVCKDHLSMTILINLVNYYLINRHTQSQLPTCARVEI